MPENNEARKLFSLMSEQPELQTYLLVNTLLAPKFWEFWPNFQQQLEAEACFLFAQSKYQELQSISPIIVPIKDGSVGETLYYWMLENQAQAQQSMLLCQAQLDLAAMQQHWQNRLDCIYPNGDESLLNAYSPGTLKLFLPSLSPEQQQGFIQPLHRIYRLVEPAPETDPQAGLDASERVAATDQAASSLLAKPQTPQQDAWHCLGQAEAAIKLLPFPQPYVLNDYQHGVLTQAYRRHQMANDIYSRLSQYHNFELELEHIHQLFLHSIEQAAELYPDADELGHETWATYRFILGSHFFQHPQFLALLQSHNLRSAIERFNRQEKYQQELQQDFDQQQWLVSDSAASH